MRVRAAAFSLALAILTAACGSVAAPGAADVVTAGSGAGMGEQRSDAGAVTIAASWLATAPSAVRVIMDTHSVDLDGLDLATLARVRLDGGPWVAPSAWDAPKGGHHREGTLAFAAVDRASLDTAQLIELEIRDVAVPSRMLRWTRSQ